MYRLEMSLSADGKLVSYEKGAVPQDIKQTICRLSLSWEKQSDIASMLTCVSQVLHDLSLPKDSQPGKPVEDQAPSTSGEVICYRGGCKECLWLLKNYKAKSLETDKDGHPKFKA